MCLESFQKKIQMRWVHKGQRGGQNFLCLKCFQKASSQATQWSMKNMTSLFHESAVCVCKVVFITFYQGSTRYDDGHQKRTKEQGKKLYFLTVKIHIRKWDALYYTFSFELIYAHKSGLDHIFCHIYSFSNIYLTKKVCDTDNFINT